MFRLAESASIVQLRFQSEDEALARALAESMKDTRRHVQPAGGSGNQRCHVS